MRFFRNFIPIPILLDPDSGYAFSAQELKREILGKGLGALLMSNPCNPTGKVISGVELEQWIKVARELTCTMLFDEFYSHYIWSNLNGAAVTVSAAEFVEDVDRDPVVIFNGLTKNWRYPGLRVAWTVGPKKVIDALASTGSFLDGGSSHPLQAAAVALLQEGVVEQETKAIRQTFMKKMELAISGLRRIGIKVEHEPQGTFYIWGNLQDLPEGLRDGIEFFRKALEKKVITVPGVFFDVNPGGRRSGRPSRFRHYMRFSFGASETQIETGLQRLQELVDNF